jgi:hypothetical protein
MFIARGEFMQEAWPIVTQKAGRRRHAGSATDATNGVGEP